MNNPVDYSEITLFVVKIPLRGYVNAISNVVIPSGSKLEWRQSDYSSGLADVLWLGRRVRVRESELFTQCLRSANSSIWH